MNIYIYIYIYIYLNILYKDTHIEDKGKLYKNIKILG